MRTAFVVICLILVSALQAPDIYAKEAREYLNEANQYYEKQDYKKAYKLYFKLAKAGHHYSQDKISHMYAHGEGKNVDLTEAYAWSVLAAESGKEEMVNNSDLLLEQTKDKAAAEKRANKLLSKYGEETLEKKAQKRARMKVNNRSGGCTGSRIGCSG